MFPASVTAQAVGLARRELARHHLAYRDSRPVRLHCGPERRLRLVNRPTYAAI
jgi:hypothetical protein